MFGLFARQMMSEHMTSFTVISPVKCRETRNVTDPICMVFFMFANLLYGVSIAILFGRVFLERNTTIKHEKKTQGGNKIVIEKEIKI